MTELFLNVLNRSISASWLILVVLGLRLVLRKTPKWVYVLLWGIVAVRLVCPFSIESAFSLMPSRETIPTNVLSGTELQIQTGIAPVDSTVNSPLGNLDFEDIAAAAESGTNVISILTIVWLVGALLLITYTAITYWRLRRKVDTAVLLRENIFQSEMVDSPFVLGIIRPRIYVPFRLDNQNLEHVISHEQAHIRRRDHWWKPLGFLLLTVYWFNPLMWVAYVLLCRDIELACDERVIRKLNSEQRAEYTQALILCSVNRRMIAACPLAFGEVGVIERVKSVMNYKKPAVWVIALSIIACGVFAVCFLTDPAENAEDFVPNDSMEAETESTISTSAEQDSHEQLAQMEQEVAALKEEIAQLQAEYQDLYRANLSQQNTKVEPQNVNAQIIALFEIIAQGNQAELLELCSYGEDTLRYCFSAILSGEDLGAYNTIMASVCHELAIQWGDELLMVVTSDADNAQWIEEFDIKAGYLSRKYSAEQFQQMYPASWIYLQMKNE